MKSNNPEVERQLDELADGLDAGWDTPAPAEVQASPSQAPLSVPPSGAVLEALDADWDTAESESSSHNSPPVTPARSAARAARKPRPIAAAPTPLRPGAAPLRVSKQERREAERKRSAHQAQQKAANKQQRKAERQEEARRASEQRRAELAEAARRAEQSAAPKRSAAAKRSNEPRDATPKQVAKRARRDSARTTPELASTDSVRPTIAQESGIKKLIPLIAIALIVGGTLCFALLRAGGR
ncbi:MAG TPA: hypothetical protein VGL19_14330 [Polyangiaceae bacterium]|jgi:hypothetical protein